jgi:hypothetical protein
MPQVEITELRYLLYSHQAVGLKFRRGMTTAQKVTCGGGFCALILVLLFPPWQQAYKSLNIPYRKDIGHSFILKQPSPVEVRSVGTVDPPSAFYVFVDTRGLLFQCAGVMVVTLVLLFALNRLRTEDATPPTNQLRFVPRIATAALLLGFTTEALTLYGLTTAFTHHNEPSWADWAFNWTQEPSRHLAVYLTPLFHPGFEEGVGYFFLILFLLQGLVYSLVAYLIFLKLRRKTRIEPSS